MPVIPTVTTAQLLAFPDDGIDRELVRGLLRVRGPSVRGYAHAASAAQLLTSLATWHDGRPGSPGLVLGPGAAFRLAADPDTVLAVDAAYLSPEQAEAIDPDGIVIDGPPTLAIEILSPADTQAVVTEKVLAYLDAGVPVTWVAEPVFRTVTVYRPDAEPAMFNAAQRIDAEPHLPGFSAAVADFFKPARRRR